jgi:3-oxoacyl-[acyl-carrier protein] reductase
MYLKTTQREVRMKALLIGSKGNIGPIWEDTLSNLGYDVFGVDISDGFDVRNVDSFKHCCEEDYSLVLYNAAIDHPPKDGVHFFLDYEDIINVNLTGAFRAAHVFMPRMAMKGSGIFIGVLSIQAYVAANWKNYEKGIRKPGGYNASKAGLMALIRSLACEYGRNGVRACGMAFGAVDTGKLPGEPFKSKFLDCLPLQQFVSEISLRSTLKFVVNTPEFTGQTVLVDGGYTAW